MLNLLQAMFSTIADTWRRPTMDVRAIISEAQDGKNSISSTPAARDDGQPEDPYADDIHRLEAALGHPLEKGACINFKLQDILHIIPKKRRRVDSYRGLVGKLNKMGVKLTINSQKSR